jgi:long-subunit fatty acid transport protein
MNFKPKNYPMRKFLTFIAAMFITGSLFAGGLVTNTNQSAAWVRLPSRNASVGIDAVYYNPAGLMKLENGFHVSISNQFISQKRQVKNYYAGPGGSYGLNQHTYDGTVKAPLFPSIYAAYKLDKFAFSIGFNPVGGGGGAEYTKGLPSFEMTPSDLVPSLRPSTGADAYRMDVYFKGSSTFMGFQGNVSYKVNSWLSVAAGLRYVTAKNTYSGHLTDIEVLIPPDNWTRADAIMNGVASGYTTAATGSSALVAAGAGSLTFAQAQAAGAITAAQRAAFEGALTAVGYPAATPIAQADAIYKGTAVKYGQTANLLADQTVDAEQTGSAIAPVFSANFSPSENLNIAVKYEMKTTLNVTNHTKQDILIAYQADGTPITMFPEGEKNQSDMPAMLTFGLDYKISPSVKLCTGINYYFDKTANYGHDTDDDLNTQTPVVELSNKDIISKNGWSISGGLEINISEKLLLSGGMSFANKGTNDKYQSDLTYGLATQTFGIGGAYSFTKKIQLNLALGYTRYSSDSKNVDHRLGNSIYQPVENYAKSTKMIAVGVNFSF